MLSAPAPCQVSAWLQPAVTHVISGPPCWVISPGRPLPGKGPLQWKTKLDAITLGLPRTEELFDAIDKDTSLCYNLPVVGSSAGKVIQHCQRVIQTTIQKIEPATFKVGFSHNPVFRFNNDLYGYKYGKDRFEAMCVLYVSAEPTPAAFLEAALIQLFQGTFPNNYLAMVSFEHDVNKITYL